MTVFLKLIYHFKGTLIAIFKNVQFHYKDGRFYYTSHENVWERLRKSPAFQFLLI
jgi:hypothetical protein